MAQNCSIYVLWDIPILKHPFYRVAVTASSGERGMRKSGVLYLFIIMLMLTIIGAQTFSVGGCRRRDSKPPTIYNVWQQPSVPEYEDSVLVMAYITDSKSGVANATLCYTVNGGESIRMMMSRTCDLYSIEIPPQPYNSTVTYVIYAYDKAGNKACSQEYAYTVCDFHPPTITFIERIPAQPNYNDTVIVVANATEPLLASGVKELILSYSNDIVWKSGKMMFNGTLYNATIPKFPYGTTVHYKIWAVDNAGNTAALDVYSYEVDDHYLPVAAITAPKDGSFLSKSVNVTFYVQDDNLYEAKLTLDDAFLATWNTTGFRTYTLDTAMLSDGLHELTLEALDNAGNMAKQTIKITVDNTAPKAEILWPKNGSLIRNTALIKLHAEDANFERMELKIDGLVYAWEIKDQTYAWNTTNYSDGTYEIALTVLDKAGNKAENRITTTVDNTAPMIGEASWTPEEPKTNETVKVSVQITDNGSGIKTATLWFRRLGEDWQSISMALENGNWTGEIPGHEENAIITFYVESCDNAGNVAESLENHYIVKSAIKEGFPGFPLYWLILAIIAIFVILASTAYYLRKRKRVAGSATYLAVSSL